MNTEELRKLIRNSTMQPFVVCLGYGAAYRVTHPDFALLAEHTLIVAAQPGQDFDGSSFVICPVSHISCVKVSKPRAKFKAGQADE